MPGSCTDVAIEILLVEDNADTADLMRDALREGSLNPHVTVVEDGVEAMLYLCRDGVHAVLPPPDLILLDLRICRA